MITNERSWQLVEPRYRQPGLNVPELDKAAQLPESMRRRALDKLQLSQDQLYARATALQVQNQELEAYAHMVAHDLKDPLTALIVTSDLITDIPDLTGTELKEYLQQIKSTAYDMNSIINNLLLFAEVSKVEAPLGPVNMAQVVEKVRDRLSYMIKENKVQIELPEAWPDAIGYAPWIEEVWVNYLSNAIKHWGQPPRIKLGASTQPDGMLRFWIRDNGHGIRSKTRARLFMPFSQVGRLRDSGHGLGLSIVLQIVEKLGGQVGVESQLGHGSLFFFTLPACKTSFAQNLLPPPNPTLAATRREKTWEII
jgi:two-component system, sensor histidine kinase and response regulator